MPSPTTTVDLLELIRKSALLDAKRLEAHMDELRADDKLPTDPNKLASVLVHDGLLTNFQAEQLLQGKWRRFSIGKYKVLERLGSGGMASVFLCEHKLMRRRVAVKVLPTARAADPASLERFYREARAVAALDHPNIVHAYDIDQDENLHFLVMEHVDGASLQEIVARSGPLPVARAASYIQQAALGLDHAHAAGLIHRDIKPANLLVDRQGTVKILDMGLARFFNDEEDILTRKYDDTVLGTADYLAPEQAVDSHDVDVRADIYSLGGTFYFLLTGRTPFGAGTVTEKLMWHQSRQPKPLSAFRKDVPPAIAALIGRMMAKMPEERLQLPGEVADALAPWVRDPIAPPSDTEIPKLCRAAAGAMNNEPTAVHAGISKSSGDRRTVPAVPVSSSARPQAPVTASGASTRNKPAAPIREEAMTDTATPIASADPTRQRERKPTVAVAPRQQTGRKRVGRVVALIVILAGTCLAIASLWLGR